MRAQSVRGLSIMAAVLSGVLLLAACGGDDDDTSAAPAAPKAAESAAPEAAATPAATPAAPATPDAASAEPAAAASPAAAAAVPASAAPKAKAAQAPKAAAPGAAPKASAGSGSSAPAAAAGAAPAAAAAPKPGAAAAVPEAPAPAGGNGGATDVGITESEIKVGSVNMEGMAGGNYIIQPIIRAMGGAVSALNDRGGIYGRKVNLITCDDGAGEVTRAKACVKKFAEQDRVFAMMSSATWSSSALHSDIAKHGLPLVGAWSYANSEWEDPWMFPTHMSMYHEAHNGALWARDVIKPKTYGLICLNSPEMQKACQNVRDVLDPSGAEMVKKIDVEISTPDMSAEVLGFRAANPDTIIHYAIHPAPILKFMIDAKQQNYYPPKGISGNHLTGEVIGSLMGEWPVGRYWTNSTYNIWGSDYMAMIKKYVPANKGMNHHITQSSVVGINFFAEAARRVGPNLTRDALVNELRTGGIYDAGPGLDQKFSWGPQKTARELGGRTEFMFKLTNVDTTARADGTPHGLMPDPDRFVLVDNID